LRSPKPLLGRVTNEGFAAARPSITDDHGFAVKMNSMRTYVVSSTLEQAEWNNSTILRGNVVDEISKLKQQPGGDLLVAGSATLVQTLAEHNLVDEYRLMVYPVVLGGGKRLFGEGRQRCGGPGHLLAGHSYVTDTPVHRLWRPVRRAAAQPACPGAWSALHALHLPTIHREAPRPAYLA
jgi:hypothetical protein